MLGLEVEYLVTKVQDSSAPLSKRDFAQLLRSLAGDGFSVYSPGSDETWRISKDSGRGFTSIQPDFCFNILEIAFPPVQNPLEFESLFNSTVGAVDNGLQSLGYERSQYSHIPFTHIPELVGSNPKISRHVDLLKARSRSKVHKFFDPFFGSKVVSTHVHMNIAAEADLDKLANYYSFEPLVPILLAEGQVYRGCIPQAKHWYYKNTFGEQYMLKNIPTVVPRSLRELAKIYRDSEPLFPGAGIDGVRDFSQIRWGNHGSVEFRSAPSFLQAQDLIDVLVFRMLQVIASHEANSIVGRPDCDWALEYERAISPEGYLPSRALLSYWQRALANARNKCPKSWWSAASRLINRLDAFVTEKKFAVGY